MLEIFYFILVKGRYVKSYLADNTCIVLRLYMRFQKQFHFRDLTLMLVIFFIKSWHFMQDFCYDEPLVQNGKSGNSEQAYLFNVNVDRISEWAFLRCCWYKYMIMLLSVAYRNGLIFFRIHHLPLFFDIEFQSQPSIDPSFLVCFCFVIYFVVNFVNFCNQFRINLLTIFGMLL